MSTQNHKLSNRRNFIYYSIKSFIAFNSILSPNILNAQMAVELNDAGEPRHNIFSFRSQNWNKHFQNLENGAILADLKTRCLHFWHENGKISETGNYQSGKMHGEWITYQFDGTEKNRLTYNLGEIVSK